MAPSYSGVWKLQTKYQYSSAFPIDLNLLPKALIAGGNVASGSADASAGSNQVQMLQISNTANATDYGDLTVARTRVAGGGSDTRFVTAGGEGTGGGSDKKDIIDYKLYTSSGNLSDFGDLADGRDDINSIGNSNVRLIFSGGGTSSGYQDVMQYITIASTGNATDFGDLSVAASAGQTGIVGTTTRGISAIGINSSYSVLNTIEYVTIASTGNSKDFGDRTNAVFFASGCASSTRGVFMGGNTDGGAGNNVNVIDYITMLSGGNATDFGDLSQSTWRAGGVSNATKGLYIGGSTNAGTTTVNTIDQITIGSTGNATDFADIATATSGHSAASAEFPALLDTLPSLPSSGNMALFNNYNDSRLESLDINTLGNTVVFGDMSYGDGAYGANGSYGGASSSTRCCIAGGMLAAGSANNIDLSTFATRGLGIDFGDLTVARQLMGGSNSTRGLYGGGQVDGGGYTDTIDYITIASAGNAIDFGNLVENMLQPGMAGSSTRMLFLGGRGSGGDANVYNDQIGYVTISSTGNTTDFGDLLEVNGFGGATSSSTRAVQCGGYTGSAGLDRMQYVTIASTGNATDFGDMLFPVTQTLCTGNATRGVWLGGYKWSSPTGNQNTIQYFTIASTGDAADFGDLIESDSGGAEASNGHGGLS